jgi:8-oxo-dGTP diphosphatase
MMISKDIEGNEYQVTAKDLTWRPSAYGIVIQEDKILLVKENGKFHLPGGGVDIGEDPKLAVLREVKEETGCTVQKPVLITLASSFFSLGANDNPPDLQHVHSLLIYYSCEYVSTNQNDIHLDEYELSAGLVPVWVELNKLDEIIVGTTVDWRPVIRQTVNNGLSH